MPSNLFNSLSWTFDFFSIGISRFFDSDLVLLTGREAAVKIIRQFLLDATEESPLRDRHHRRFNFFAK